MVELSFAERLQYDAARSLLASGVVGLAPKLLRQRSRAIDGFTLHPELQLMLALRDLTPARQWSQLTVARARAQISQESRISAGPRLQVGPVRNLQIPGPAGDLRVRHYAPPQLGPQPLVVFFHGGGFVLGDLESHDQPCRMLCKHAGVHVLSVEYRLAPEHPFPAGLEDAFAALLWAHENAEALGAVPGRVSVCGDSAGGNLAAATVLKAKQTGGPLPAAQLLFYPSVDRVSRYRSLEVLGKDYFLTRKDIEWCTEHYAGGMDLRNPLITPLLAPDLSGLSPALVVTAGFDPLRDEGDAYEMALRKAGNVTRLHRATDLIHGFINMTGVSPACEAALIDISLQFRAFLDSQQAT